MGQARSVIVSAWYSGRWWLWLLRPLELLFRSIASLRRLAYKRGLLACYKADRPVVIIGNITVGGSGKTPVVIALVEALREQGLRAGVVSRGYGAKGSLYPHIVTASSGVADCGDEALLVFQRTACPCAVAPVRAMAVRALLDKYDLDIVIGDDGLQHYALQRDMEIALLDAQLGCGNGFCLPAGPLREPVSRLAEVDFVLRRGSDSAWDGVRYFPDCLVQARTGEEAPPVPQYKGEPVYAVAGIGHPAQFFEFLERFGFSLTRLPFADHHHFTLEDLEGLGDKRIIMTEKDAVKCRAFAADNVWYVRISARVPETVISAVAALAQQ